MCQQLIACTPEGCSIRRDPHLGYTVECNSDEGRPLHAATLAAAYALCQQLMPRRWRQQR